MRRIIAVLSVAFLSVGLVACTGSPPPSEGGPTKVKVILDWLWGAEHSAFAVAQEKGFFAEEDLEVEISPGQGSPTTAKLVANDSADFGLVAAATIVSSRAEGMPIRVAATMLQQLPTTIFAPSDSGIESLEDLYGKKLAVDTSSANYNEWAAVAELNGIDRSKIEEINAGQTDIQSLLAGKIDASMGFEFNQALEYEMLGGSPTLLPFRDLGLNVPGASIITSDQMIEKSPEVVSAFVRALVKGLQYTVDKPDDAVEIFLAAHADVDAEYSKRKLPLVIQLLGEGDEIGVNNEKAWSNLIQMYEGQGLLRKPVTAKELLWVP